MLQRTRLPRSALQQPKARLLCPDPDAPAPKRARWAGDDEVRCRCRARRGGLAAGGRARWMEAQARGGCRLRAPCLPAGLHRPLSPACTLALQEPEADGVEAAAAAGPGLEEERDPETFDDTGGWVRGVRG